MADATYLAVQALTGETLVCGGSPDCFRVLSSSYVKVGGIPLALFGTLAYFSVFSFATFAVFGYARARTFLILTIGAMFFVTLWLLYVQAFLLHAYCLDGGTPTACVGIARQESGGAVIPASSRRS